MILTAFLLEQWKKLEKINGKQFNGFYNSLYSYDDGTGYKLRCGITGRLDWF
jgi:hypothetical protein